MFLRERKLESGTETDHGRSSDKRIGVQEDIKTQYAEPWSKHACILRRWVICYLVHFSHERSFRISKVAHLLTCYFLLAPSVASSAVASHRIYAQCGVRVKSVFFSRFHE